MRRGKLPLDDAILEPMPFRAKRRLPGDMTEAIFFAYEPGISTHLMFFNPLPPFFVFLTILQFDRL